jgi:uncharacterized coiled-coil DUF342 family protein
MLKNQEKDEAKAKETEDKLKKEIKEGQDEIAWLKKEVDGVSEILIKRNHEIKDLNQKVSQLQLSEEQALAQSIDKQEQINSLTQKVATAQDQSQKLQQKLANLESEHNLKHYD